METKRKWQYAVIGNIVKTHLDEEGIVRYGTKQFKGGTKVYLCGKSWNPDNIKGEIQVLGLSRGHHFQVFDVPVELIENVRCGRAYNPAVLEIMNNWEFKDYWWTDTMDDKTETAQFVNNWPEQATKCADPVLKLKRMRAFYKENPEEAMQFVKWNKLPYTKEDLENDAE